MRGALRTTLLTFALLYVAYAGAQSYFPPLIGNNWDTENAGYDPTALQELNTFLDTTGTKAFILLENGRIAHEQYFDSFTQDSLWYWASAGKTMTSFLIGLAEADGLISRGQNSKAYLGPNWSSCGSGYEDTTTVLKHLTMTTGPDHSGDLDCTNPSCLTCSGSPDPWFYHNAPYTLLTHMLDSVTPNGLAQYIIGKLSLTTGVIGSYVPLNDLRVFVSTARSMARFGLLVLNEGTWNGNVIMASGSGSYYDAMINTSQSANLSYGYLWWLNGKSSYMLPGTAFTFNGPLIPNAPADLFAGPGKNDQKLYVIPGQDRVIIRLGNDGGQGLLAANSYDNQLWTMINALDGTSSLSEVKNKLELYPNPTSGAVYIPSAREGQVFIVFDIADREAQRGRVGKNGEAQLILSAGDYFIRVADRVEKIIVE